MENIEKTEPYFTGNDVNFWLMIAKQDLVVYCKLCLAIPNMYRYLYKNPDYKADLIKSFYVSTIDLIGTDGVPVKFPRTCLRNCEIYKDFPTLGSPTEKIKIKIEEANQKSLEIIKEYWIWRDEEAELLAPETYRKKCVDVEPSKNKEWITNFFEKIEIRDLRKIALIALFLDEHRLLDICSYYIAYRVRGKSASQIRTMF